MGSSNKSIHYFRDAHFIYANLFNANIEDPEIVPDLIWVFLGVIVWNAEQKLVTL